MLYLFLPLFAVLSLLANMLCAFALSRLGNSERQISLTTAAMFICFAIVIPVLLLWSLSCVALADHYGICQEIVHTDWIYVFITLNMLFVFSGIVLISFLPDSLSKETLGASITVHLSLMATPSVSLLILYYLGGAGTISYQEYVQGVLG